MVKLCNVKLVFNLSKNDTAVSISITLDLNYLYTLYIQRSNEFQSNFTGMRYIQCSCTWYRYFSSCPKMSKLCNLFSLLNETISAHHISNKAIEQGYGFLQVKMTIRYTGVPPGISDGSFACKSSWKIRTMEGWFCSVIRINY